MLKTIWLLALLLTTLPCFAQIFIEPNPQATAYLMYAGQPVRAVISPMTDEEKGQMQRAYDTVLRNSAALDAEGDALSAQETAYKKVLIAAIVKADPQVAAVLQGGGDNATREQHDQIVQDQASVMQADPNLQKQWDDLMKKMTAHQKAIDAAMIKVDPDVQQILAKLSP